MRKSRMAADPGRRRLPRLADYGFIQFADVVTPSSLAKRTD